MKSIECPRFNRCKAALCPLDEDWQRRSMTREDSVCFYLTESVKDGAEARFKGVPDEGIYACARSSLPEMVAASNTLKKRLERASKTGSRLDAIRRWTAYGSIQQDGGDKDTQPEPRSVEAA